MKIKKLICTFLTLCLLAALNGCAQETPSEPTSRTVSTLSTIKTESYHDGEVTHTIHYEYVYDETGHNSQRIITDNDGTVIKEDFERDAWGNILKTTRTVGDEVSIGENELTLDSQHRVVKQISSSDGKVLSITEIGYDAQGREIRLDITRKIEGTEDAVSKTSREFDANGNVTRVTVIWDDDPPLYEINHYDDSGRHIKTIETDSNGAVITHTSHSYDETGLVKTSVTYDADGTEQVTRIYTYDEEGHLLSVESYVGGELSSRTEYTYIEVTVTG